MEINDRIEIVKGDITTLTTDAIVNAANSSLLGGGGVDGAIHRAGGPALLAECRQLKGCPAGKAKITGGHNLTAKYVIHTVGPVWMGGDRGEPKLLAECYRNSLRLAAEHKIRSIAFPSVSTGVYGYPVELASAIALNEIKVFLENDSTVDRVIVVCFDDETYSVYKKNYREIISKKMP